MSFFAILIGIALVSFVIIGLLASRIQVSAAKNSPTSKNTQKVNQPDKLPYLRRRSILTANELSFFKVLQPMINPHWYLFTKVRLEDIIEVPKDIEFREKQRLRGHIKLRHVDFVVCDATTLEVLMCIELDDRSHQRAKAKEADAYKDRAMRDAGLTLIRVPTRHAYSQEYIRKFVFEEEDEQKPPSTGPEPVTTNGPEAVDPNERWKPPAAKVVN